VGSRPAGASWVGALDMSGNVSEWVADWFAENYDEGSPASDPPGPPEGEVRVLRGGAWVGDCAVDLCAPRRGRFNPDSEDRDGGFRAARSFE
jgi:formylglycine-generating enzyme required for sulfatase activity